MDAASIASLFFRNLGGINRLCFFPICSQPSPRAVCIRDGAAARVSFSPPNQSSDEMSKAFTRESDDLPDVPVVARQPSPLPPGAKNYLTPDGARRLREELDRLVQVERPRQVPSPDNPEAKRQLQVLDQRHRSPRPCSMPGLENVFGSNCRPAR